MFCESCTERGDSSVQEAGEDGYGSEKVTYFQESCGLMMQSHYCNPHDPRMRGKCLSVCLSVCPSVCSRISLGFFSEGEGGVRTSYCKRKKGNW